MHAANVDFFVVSIFAFKEDVYKKDARKYNLKF